MDKYSGAQKEAQLKNLVFDDYFDGAKFSWEQEIDNIDFIITNPKTRHELFAGSKQGASLHYLWAEVKKGSQDVYEMLTQLILTCKKTYDKGDVLAPRYIGCFDEGRIAFVPFHTILPIFTDMDINWKQKASGHDTSDFQTAMRKTRSIIGADITIFNFGSDDDDIKYFINTHIGVEGAAGIKNPINKDNFVQIYIKWLKQVKPTINIPKQKWESLKKNGVDEADFFRADMMSSGGNTINDKLKIFLENDKYKYQQVFDGDLFTRIIDFTDGGEAYRLFWTRYERPPVEEYQQYIVDRRDLLMSENIREQKGAYYTPGVVVRKSREYLNNILGADWQEKYYIWDCAAGSGNLLTDLSNKYNVWASTLDSADVETMKALVSIDEHLQLIPEHIFQFDFLNDDFEKLPEDLREVLKAPEKRKKLIFYINPPYGEAATMKTPSGTRGNKPGVATGQKTYNQFKEIIGSAALEKFAHFFMRIYEWAPECILAAITHLKYVNSPNFVKFRECFKAHYLGGFIFDDAMHENATGHFPCGFLMWDLDIKETIAGVACETIDKNGIVSDTKSFYPLTKPTIAKWIVTMGAGNEKIIGQMIYSRGGKLENSSIVRIENKGVKTTHNILEISRQNLIPVCVYFSVRWSIPVTWINNADQFTVPDDTWESDFEFQYDCLVFTLFHFNNKIRCVENKNHWIPFTEKQLDSKNKFYSNFMSDFLKDKTLSAEAQLVYQAGLELWKYYHLTIKNNQTVSINASLYDIRAFFQGRNDNGKMKAKSTDGTYNTLIETLREKQKLLAAKIGRKVYEYGFLAK